MPSASAASIIGHWVALDLLATGVPSDVSTDLAPGLAPNKPAETALPLIVPDAPGDYLLDPRYRDPQARLARGRRHQPDHHPHPRRGARAADPGAERQPGRDHGPKEHDRSRRGTIGACPRRLPRWSAPTHPISTRPTTRARTPPAERIAALADDVAAEPVTTPGEGHGPHRDRVLDGPDDDRAGVFYPDGADTAEERLGYYASRFPLVEVDSTYYALPARRTRSSGSSARRRTSRSISRPTR